MKKYLTIAILILFLLLGLVPARTLATGAISSPVNQQDAPKSACFSLDVVFIIDQSGSMSDSMANDPTKQRVYAPRWAIDWLADNAYDICPDSIHRVAVISFGASAQIDLPLSEINPNDAQEYQDIRTELKKNITASVLGQTDPQKAFDMAAGILKDAGPLPSGSPRKRVIIFLTDGAPCVTSLGCSPDGTKNKMDTIKYTRDMRDYIDQNLPFDQTLLNQEECLKDSNDKYAGQQVPANVINKCLETYPVAPDDYQKSTFIWTMFLRNKTVYSLELRKVFSNISENHGGQLIDLKKNKEDIPATFLNILSNLVGVQATRLACGDFAVNPYLRQARLVFFKISENTKVILSYPDAQGNPHVLQDGKSDDNGGFNIAEHYSEGTNERYVLNAPYPGIWSFQSDDCDDGIDAYFEQIKFDIGGLQPVTILMPDKTAIAPEASYNVALIEKYGQDPFFNVDKPYFLQYTLRDTQGAIVQPAEKPFFGVQYTVVVTDPQGNVTPYVMEWISDSQLFQSVKPLVLPVQGEYKVHISGDAANRDYPYGPIDKNATPESVFNTSRHLFDYDSKFNVICPGLDLVNSCPWATQVATDACSFCPVKKFDIQLLSPKPGEALGTVHDTIARGWPLKVKEFPIRFQIIGDQGEVLDLPQALNNPTKPVKLTLTSGGQNRNIVYTRESEGSNIFTGNVQGMDGQGQYKIKVELTSDHSQFYSPVHETVEREFSRTDGPWNRSSTYLTTLYVIIAVILLFILYNILIRTNRVKGVLVFRHYDGEEVAVISLNSGKNTKTIGGRALSAYPQLDLKRIKARFTSRRARVKKREEDVLETIEGFSASAQPGVRVEFTPKSSPHFTETLQPGQAIPFSAHGEDNLFQVEYRNQ